MDELDFYRMAASDAQKSAWAVLNELGWPKQITTNNFRGRPGATGIGKWLQKCGYTTLPCSEAPDGVWRDKGGRPFTLYQKNAG